MQTFRKIISFFLLAAFIIATTPHDLLHVFAHHDDTVHCNSATTSVSPHHIHCEILQLALPEFQHHEAVQVASAHFITAELHGWFNSTILFECEVPSVGRAPPVIA